MSRGRLREIMERRDEVSKQRFYLPEDFTYQDALLELHEAVEAKSDEKIDEAFFHLAYSMVWKNLDEAVKNVEQYPYPKIRTWIRNIDAWYKRFDKDRKKYLQDLILETKEAFLEKTLDDHIEHMNH